MSEPQYVRITVDALKYLNDRLDQYAAFAEYVLYEDSGLDIWNQPEFEKITKIAKRDYESYLKNDREELLVEKLKKR